MTWIVETLRAHPELAIFVALAIGFWIGPKKIAGFNLGNVTATLLAAVLIGQLGIEIPGPIKATFFMLFLFAVGYGVGPQFFAGLGKGWPEADRVLAGRAGVLSARPLRLRTAGRAGYRLRRGFYAGSQTTSAAIGVATDQINRLGLSAEQAKAYADAIPIAYAVTYIFGTIGSAMILAQIGPRMIGVDLAQECADYEVAMGGVSGQDAGVFSAYRNVEARAYRVEAASLTGKPVRDLFPGLRIFVERVRRGDQIIEADAMTSCRQAMSS
jgi:putative transport protein